MKNRKIFSPPSMDQAKALVRVALGEEKADIVVMNAGLVNVYTGEIIENYSVSIKDEWIAYVGDHPSHTIGPETVLVDARGKTVIPGLIDGHTHLAFFYSGHEFLKFAMAGGTTTIVTETMEVFPVGGYDGVVEFLDSMSNQPIKVLGTAPAMVSTSRATHGVPADVLRKLLDRDDILGLGEVYWQAVFQTPDIMMPLLNETLCRGKTIDGHSAGAKGKKLAAYAAAGVTSCHEPITAAEVVERLRLGLHVIIREGSIRRELEAVSKLKDSGIDFRRAAISTDGLDPEDVMAHRDMAYVVQRAIDYGFDPVTAVQMATLNVAEHFGLDRFIGGIAPGRYADLVVIPNPETIKAELVISSGKIIARNGNPLVPPRAHLFSDQSRAALQLARQLEAKDFRIGVDDGFSSKDVRVIDLITDLVTKEQPITMPVENGEIPMNRDQDILKVAAIDRTHEPGKMFTGLVKGFGLAAGAMASSTAWDTTDIIVVGADEADMALAVNRIYDMGGGAVVCKDGSILADLALPVFGIMSEAPMAEIAQKTATIKKAAAGLGVPHDDPLLTLNVLTGAAIPYLRICEEGLVNLRDGKTLGLFND
jgi:adenine deaminase